VPSGLTGPTWPGLGGGHGGPMEPTVGAAEAAAPGLEVTVAEKRIDAVEHPVPPPARGEL
jgi:hypothetical protein